MSTLGYILLFTFLGSFAALFGGFLLLLANKIALKASHFLASFSAGVLIGTAFFDLLPEAIDAASGGDIDVFLWATVGIVLFFLIERFIHTFHHHEKHHDDGNEGKVTIPLIVIGDAVHNFIDGVVIAATFLTNIQLGIVTTMAVFAHEVPQEISDFGLLLHKGMSRKKVIWVNIFSSLSAFLGAILTYTMGNIVASYIPIFLGLTAGFFIYIAASDLIPEIHYEKKRLFALIHTAMLILGISIIWLSVKFIEPTV